MLYLGKGKKRTKVKKKERGSSSSKIIKFPPTPPPTKKKSSSNINREGRWVISHQTHSLPLFSLVFSLNWGENFFLLNGGPVEKTTPPHFPTPPKKKKTKHDVSPFFSSIILPPTKQTLRASHRVGLHSLYFPPFWVQELVGFL